MEDDMFLCWIEVNMLRRDNAEHRKSYKQGVHSLALEWSGWPRDGNVLLLPRPTNSKPLPNGCSRRTAHRWCECSANVIGERVEVVVQSRWFIRWGPDWDVLVRLPTDVSPMDELVDALNNPLRLPRTSRCPGCAARRTNTNWKSTKF